MSINESIFNFLYAAANKSLVLDLIIVFLAHYLLYLLVFAAIAMIFFERDYKRRYYFVSLAALSVILSSGILVSTINYIFYNPRPFVALEGIKALVSHPANSSFPSGHMMFIVPIALSIFYLNKRMGIWFLSAAALMGAARIMAGVHWPLDILAGIFLGALSFYIAKALLNLSWLK